MRARPGSRALTLRAVHDAILRVAQPRRGSDHGAGGGELRVRELWRDGSRAAHIVLVQSTGAAMVFAQNCTKQTLTSQFLLHGSAVGATSADTASSSGVPLYTLKPAQQAVIAAVANVPDQDYEGSSAAAEGFALDGFGALLADCGLTGEDGCGDGRGLHSLHAPVAATSAQAEASLTHGSSSSMHSSAFCAQREDSALQAALAASLLERGRGDKVHAWTWTTGGDADLNAAIAESLSAGRESGSETVVIND